MTYSNPHTHGGYGAGHSWYYLLGGKVLSPKQIREATRQSGYQGYARDDIHAADRKAEPQRSASLRQFREKFEADVKKDLRFYRQMALTLHRYRKQRGTQETPICSDDIHMAMSLKHNHLVNGFAHLILIDELLNQQGDLFGL